MEIQPTHSIDRTANALLSKVVNVPPKPMTADPVATRIDEDMARGPDELARLAAQKSSEIGDPNLLTRLEARAAEALAEIRRARARQAHDGLPTRTSLELARHNILASVAELRNAMVPPALTSLDRRR